MFRLASAKTLKIRIDDRALSFQHLGEFEFAMSGRCGVPLARIRGLKRLDDAALRTEAERIRRMTLRFAQALADTPSGSSGLSAFLLSLEISSVSQDHGWRSILETLGQFDASVDAFKRVALARYSQYLAAREELARVLLQQRRANAPLDNAPEIGKDPDSMTSTMVIDAVTTEASKPSTSYDRLPKGEAIDVVLGTDESMPLILVTHRCQLLGGSVPEFVDAQGHRTSLPRGRTVVGRDAGSDIQIFSDRRDISRKHLIVERSEGHLLRLTDISSLGTFIPPSYLDKTGSC